MISSFPENFGTKSSGNSTTTPLGAGATFTGEWEVTNDSQIGFNILSDTDGTLFVEFSIDGSSALTTLTKSYQIFANEPDFDALVKLPGRYFRFRFVNTGGAQSVFGLLASTAKSGLFPYAISDRDSPAFLASSITGTTATNYKILVDLSDRATFPHHYTGRCNLHSAFFFVDKGANTAGAVRIGVITSINGTNATITYIQGVSFSNTSDKAFARDRLFNTPLILGQSGGVLTRVGGPSETVTEVNTGIALDTPYGTAIPAVGDVVVKYTYTSGAPYSAFASVQYNTSSSTT